MSAAKGAGSSGRLGLVDHALYAFSLLLTLLSRLVERAQEAKSQAIGQRITDEINKDPEEVARLLRAREQAREGKRRRLTDE